MNNKESFQHHHRLAQQVVFLFIFLSFAPLIAGIIHDDEINLFRIGKIIVIIYTGYYLIKGKKWAKNVLAFFAIVTALQALTLTYRSENLYWIVYAIIIMIVFGIIAWYLLTSEGLKEFLILSDSGAVMNGENLKNLDEILPNERIHIVDVKEFDKEDSYTLLTEELMASASGFKKPSVRVIKTNSTEKWLEIYDDELSYEIKVSNRLAIFDRNFITELNLVLKDIGSPQRIVAIHKNRLGSKHTTPYLHLALVNPTELNLLIQNGYLKK